MTITVGHVGCRRVFILCAVGSVFSSNRRGSLMMLASKSFLVSLACPIFYFLTRSDNQVVLKFDDGFG